MKKNKIALIFLVFFAFVFSLKAQEEPSWKQVLPRHDLQFGIGDPALIFVTEGNFIWIGCVTWPEYQTADEWFSGRIVNTLTFATPTFNFEYRYRFAKWFWFGGAISYTAITDRWKNVENSELVAHTAMNYLSIMPSVRFSWLNKKYITLYSGLSLGAAVSFGKVYSPKRDQLYNEAGVRMAGQLTAVGIQGGKNWYGFAEVGIGNQGFVKAGFGYKFNKQAE